MSKSVWEAYALFVKENAGYMKICCLVQWKQKKSHTCKEGGAHLRISVWHLLMNLKNKYLLKKTLLSGPIKNLRILIFTMLHVKKKRKTPSDIIILHLCTKNLDDMIYSFWDIEYDRMKLVIMGLSLLLYPVPIKTQKIWILKKWRKLLQISSFYNHVPKTKIIWDTEVFVIMGHFFLFKPHSP